MAIVQDTIAVEIAKNGVSNAGNLINATESMLDDLEWGNGAGINLIDYDSVFSENGDVQHTDGAYLNKLFAKVAVDLKAWLEAQSCTVNGHGTKTYLEIVQQCRAT